MYTTYLFRILNDEQHYVYKSNIYLHKIIYIIEKLQYFLWDF